MPDELVERLRVARIVTVADAQAAADRIEALVEALEIAKRYMPDRQAEYPERLERDREIVRAALQGESDATEPAS